MKSLRSIATLIVLALALALPGFSQNADNKQFLSADSTFTLVLPGTPSKSDPVVRENGTQTAYTVTDSKDNLRFSVIEEIYTPGNNPTADAAIIAFNRSSDVTVIDKLDYSVPGADSTSAEIVDVTGGTRGLVIFAARGNELIALSISTDTPTDEQIQELTAVAGSLKFNTASTN